MKFNIGDRVRTCDDTEGTVLQIIDRNCFYVQEVGEQGMVLFDVDDLTLIHPALKIGDKVRTVKLETEPRGYVYEAMAARRWGVEGMVYEISDSHGLCYGICHDDDGSLAYYEPNELDTVQVITTVADLIAALQKCDPKAGVIIQSETFRLLGIESVDAQDEWVTLVGSEDD